MIAAMTDEGSLGVLVVDDEPLIRSALRDMLEDEGIAVLGEAGDGNEAVALARKLTPDVILMDLRMPGMGGIDAIQAIRAERPASRVIVLSAYDDPGLSNGATQAGAVDYLVKGCPPAAIFEAIHRAAGR
jgi:DNA-binding NarL/FixJ family response regulator